MEIRVAEEKDLDGLMRLINQAFAVERFFIHGDRLTPLSIREYFGNGQFLLAEEDGALAADNQKWLIAQAADGRCHRGI